MVSIGLVDSVEAMAGEGQRRRSSRYSWAVFTYSLNASLYFPSLSSWIASRNLLSARSSSLVIKSENAAMNTAMKTAKKDLRRGVLRRLNGLSDAAIQDQCEFVWRVTHTTHATQPTP